MPKPIDPEKRAAIEQSIREGAGTRSAGSIAREFQVGRTTVLRIAQQAGLDGAWDRTKTLHASRATAIDNKAVRAQLAADHLSDAVEIRKRLWEPAEAMTAMGEIVMMSLPPARDVKDFMTSVGAALKVSMEVEKHDAGDATADDAKSMLLGVAEGLRSMVRAQDQAPDEGTSSEG